MKKNVFSLHGKNIVDLIKENPPSRPPRSAAPAPASHRVRGNHNIVIGGNVSIHLSASAFQAGKDGRHE